MGAHGDKRRSAVSFRAATLGVLMVLGASPIDAVSGASAGQSDVDQLKAELAALKERLQEFESLKQRMRELEDRLAALKSDEIAKKESVSEPDSGSSGATQDRLDIGGALRFNYFWKDFDESLKTRRGDIGLDLFRINVDGEKKNLLLSAEYRWYRYMDTIHHGWVGYDFGAKGRLEAGLTRVPFGLLPYASHNYWFGVPFYLGLADDYDTGVKYVRQSDPWDVRLAFFKNGDLGNATDLNRYSYDVVSVDSSRNEESNQLNGRLAYTMPGPGSCAHELGLSGQWGQLFNSDTGDTGHHWAGAGHIDSRCGRWNFQLEVGRYGYDPRNPAAQSRDTIALGAFAASHRIAARGTFGVANIAYNVPVRGRWLDVLTCYNDFSVLRKDDERFENSYLNTTGCGIGIGPSFTYVDVIRGKNMLFFGDGSLAGNGASGDWDTRFNVNFGYYF